MGNSISSVDEYFLGRHQERGEHVAGLGADEAHAGVLTQQQAPCWVLGVLSCFQQVHTVSVSKFSQMKKKRLKFCTCWVYVEVSLTSLELMLWIYHVQV